MGVYKYLKAKWQEEGMDNVHKRERLMHWRREPVTLRISHPTRLDRAHALGYRAKPGIFVVRQRVDRRTHRRPTPAGGRRTKNQGTKMILRKNYRMIAEERASRAYVNCEVLNSYYVAEDGKHYWFEVIFADRAHPQIVKDHRIKWVANQRGRAHRGLTSAGRKVRGLHYKGKGTEKARPSRRAHSRRL